MDAGPDRRFPVRFRRRTASRGEAPHEASSLSSFMPALGDRPRKKIWSNDVRRWRSDPVHPRLVIRRSAFLRHPLIWIKLNSLRLDWRALHKDLLYRLATHPDAPVVVCVTKRLAERPLDITRVLKRVNARAVVLDNAPQRELRRQLTKVRALPPFVARWFSTRGAIPASELSRVSSLVAASRCGKTLQDVRAAGRISPRTIRRRFHQRGLPPPGAWLKLGHVLKVGLTLQRNIEQPLDALHRQLGFSDPSCISHLLKRQLGWSATEIRETLGVDPILDRWWTNSGRNYVSLGELTGPSKKRHHDVYPAIT